jgi:hypothetical protein
MKKKLYVEKDIFALGKLFKSEETIRKSEK